MNLEKMAEKYRDMTVVLCSRKCKTEYTFLSEKYKMIGDNGYDADSIIKNISLIDPSHKFIPGKTLIFFDEVQEDLRANKNLGVYKGARTFCFNCLFYTK